MRILIISLPRTGSTSLLKRYVEKYKLDRFDEPFSSLGNREYNLEDGSAVKTIISHKSVEFYSEYSTHFNEVILLSRKDLKACAESMAFLSYNIDKGYKHNRDYTWEYTPNLESTKVYIQECSKDLEKLSENINIPITYYEDIFDIGSPDKQRKHNKSFI